MSSQLTCQKCGFENEFNRLHCSKCGERLSFKTIEKKHRQACASRQHRFTFKLLIRLALFIGLMALLLLMLWPIKPSGQIGGEADVAQYASRLFQLEVAVKDRREAVQVFQEREINAYLLKLIEHNQSLSAGQAQRLNLKDVNVRLRARDILLVVTVRQGPVYFSYAFAVTPQVRDGQVAFRIDRLEWGHLPLPEFARTWLMERVARMFAGLKSERTVLDRAAALDVKEGLLRVSLPDG